MSLRYSAQQTCAMVVELHCPALSTTIHDFLITSSATIESIKARFPGRLEQFWPCDTNGETICTAEDIELIENIAIEGDPVFNFRNLVHGERIIVRLRSDERFSPNPKRETMLYFRDDMGEKTFKSLSRQNRRHHIRSLHRSEAIQRKNILRLTASHVDVTSELTKPRYSKAIASRIIYENWKVSQASQVDQKCLGAMAVLNQATCGQPLVVDDLLMTEVLARWNIGWRPLHERDVLKVIDDLYKEADAMGSKWAGD